MNRTSSRHHDPIGPTCRRGFTLIEIIVLMALLAIVTLLAFPAVRSMIAKARLESSVQSVATTFLSARYQAIRYSKTVRVTIDLAEDDTGTRWIESILDRNADGAFDPNDPSDLVAGRFAFPDTVVFEAPTLDPADAVDGFSETPLVCTVFFRPDGSADLTGAIRITHDRDPGADGPRYFEIRISTAATARVVINEWDDLAGKWVLFNRSEQKL